MALIQCIYCSASSKDKFTTEDLNSILDISRHNNAALEVTGVLLYEDGSFFQVLEGEANIVDQLFQKLLLDPRHTDVRMIISEPIEKRTFSEWSMAYPTITMSDIEAMSGLNDFFLRGRSYLNVQDDTAGILLDAFRKGDWHI